MASPSHHLLLMQGPLALGVLLLAIAFPGAGGAAVLIGPGTHSAAPAIAWAHSHDMPLLGLAADGTAPIVRMPRSADALAALRAGFVPLAADRATCGASPQLRGFRQ